MRVLLFHNPSAGGGNEPASELTAAFEHAGYQVDHRTTKGGIDPQGTEAYDLVAIAGGDGTVGKALPVLHGRDLCVTILPLGTANNIASFLGIRGEPEALVAGLAQGTERRLDLAAAQGSWGHRLLVEGFGIGAIAQGLATAKAQKLSGDDKIAAGRTILPQVIRDAPPLRLSASLDGNPLPEELLALEALCTPVIGPRLCLAPKARPGDGLLHLAYLRPERRQAFLDWMAEDPDGRPSPLESASGRQVHLTGGSEALHLDDDYPETPEGHVNIALAPSPLRVLVPQPESSE